MKAPHVANYKDYLYPDAAFCAKAAHDDVSLIPPPLVMQPTEYIRKSLEELEYGKTKSLNVACTHDGTL
jgi:hypothetical protein